MADDLKLSALISTFSTNVYKELSFDELRREYFEAKDEIQELRQLINTNKIKNP